MLNIYKSLFPLLVVCAIGVSGLVGCSRGPEVFAVAGTVNLDGKPVESGSITFIPINASPEGTTFGEISQGRYSLECVAGEMRVLILGMATATKPVPLRYAESGDLIVNVSAENVQIDFELTEKPLRRSK